MFGHYKQKIINFIDSRIQKYLETHKQAEPVKEKEKSGFFAGDISMAQAENKNRQEKLKKLTENLKYSFQQGIEKFGFDKMKYEKNGKTYAMDEVLKPQDFVGLKGSPKDIIFTFFAKFGFIGYQICSILGQHWLISNACSLANQDALRNGWQNVFIETDDKNKDDNNDEDKEKKQKMLTDLYTVQQTKFNLNEVLLKWAYYRNLYGVSYLLPIIDGIDYEKPYNPDGIKKGSLKGFTVIEPYWMIPQFDKDAMTDPTNMKFLEPEYFLTNNGKKIHASHLIISKRKYVSDIMKASYYFGGISLAQEIYERVYAAEKSANEAPLILLTKRLNVYKIRDFRDIFTNPEAFIDRLKTLTEYRDNQGFLFCDKEDDIMQIDTALTDFDETVKQQYGLVSAVARVPEDKLFEKNPTGGLSSNGSYNEKNYTQDLNTLQTGVFQKAIDRINEITLRSEFESKDKVYIVFNPTDNPTEEEVTNLNKTKADTTAIYIANGVISPEEARMRLVEDKTAGYSFLKGVEMEEPSDEDKAEIENMIKEAQKKKNNNDNENGSAEDEIDEDVEWITVKGNHIPIKEGETKEEAIKEFLKSKKENKTEIRKLSDNDRKWIEEKLYALNKKAKEYRGLTSGKNIAKKQELYDIKNKLIKKYGKKTGKVHLFNKGLGVEYTIEGLGSFHDYYYFVEDYVNEKNIEKLQNVNPKEISSNIESIKIERETDISENRPSNIDITVKTQKNTYPYPFEYYLKADGIVDGFYYFNVFNFDFSNYIEKEIGLPQSYYDVERLNYLAKQKDISEETINDAITNLIENSLYKIKDLKERRKIRKEVKSINLFEKIKNRVEEEKNRIKEYEKTKEEIQNFIDSKHLLTESKVRQDSEFLGEIPSENKRNIELSEEDIEKLKNFAEDKGINDIINILFAIDNKIYEIEEKSKAEDTDFDESKVNRDEKGRFAAKNSSANTESEQESSRK